MVSPIISWEEWAPIYGAIRSSFGYDEAGDQYARDELAARLPDSVLGLADLPDMSGQSVAIAGAARRLRHELSTAAEAEVVVAASSAARVLDEAGIAIDLVVTDLDGTPETAVALAEAGTPVAIHAHGDNRALLGRWVPAFPPESIFPTTQTRPIPRVENPGGFTDGDRAAFIAAACGGRRFRFPGWEFDDPAIPLAKRQKLDWAERLLYWLEQRLGERFGLLDGRREAIELVSFPPP